MNWTTLRRKAPWRVLLAFVMSLLGLQLTAASNQGRALGRGPAVRRRPQYRRSRRVDYCAEAPRENPRGPSEGPNKVLWGGAWRFSAE